MPNEIKTKQTFGSAEIVVTRPTISEPKVLNIIVSFEDALKLHLSLGQALAKLNSYNRATTGGKRSAINVCLHTQMKRITINEAQLPSSK
jgi:hypothetical protein